METFNPANAGMSGIDEAARAQVNFKPSDDTLLYAAYNRGIKGFIEQAYGPPRQIGAAVTYRWQR